MHITLLTTRRIDTLQPVWYPRKFTYCSLSLPKPYQKDWLFWNPITKSTQSTRGKAFRKLMKWLEKGYSSINKSKRWIRLLSKWKECMRTSTGGKYNKGNKWIVLQRPLLKRAGRWNGKAFANTTNWKQLWGRCKNKPPQVG